ncbi:MAG TPA: DUF6259 domain-containing protein [Phycisphaerae bacterium]|nr:DUF6259 domain-containing protein [Phycisphaerae bacterium]HOM50949.1 DUF6259 domain-containing protein [Phycisphaerae bacterium]
MIPLLHAVILGIVLSASPSVDVQDTRLTIKTATVEVVFDGPVLTSLRPAGSTVEFIHPNASGPGVDLMYLDSSTVGTDKQQTIAVRKLSDFAARVEISGADTERTLTIVPDPDTGDIRITPDGVSNRRGLRAVRWTLAAHPQATAILPCVNGLEVRSDRPHPPTRRFPWPFEWNAQLAILQQADASVMVHCEDRAYQFKALHLIRSGDRVDLGFESEPPGPLWDNRTAGGIEWRLNAYRGDWKTPATRYRKWMEHAYDLAAKRQHRPAWVKDIKFVQCWAASVPEMLDALAAVHPPHETLIHLSDWRTDKYDVNYPEYTPSDQTLAYMAKAREMGFHVMPHFNYYCVWYQHPFYQKVRDFQLRTVDQNRPDGWHWPPETHNYTRMAYIHPGFGVWRNKLIEVVSEACSKTGTDVAFLDQTLCTWNTDNGLVQGMNTIEGMHKLQEQLAAIHPGLVLAGEGLNEISFQWQCFAQAHIFEGWGKLEQKHVDAQHSICQFLWGDHTRLIGYYHVSPGNEDFDKGIATYERMGALPTIVTNNPKDLREPSELTRRILDRAAGRDRE